MCLITKQLKPEILKEDLTVYKEVKTFKLERELEQVRAMLYHFTYHKDKVYYTVLEDAISITPYDPKVSITYGDFMKDLMDARCYGHNIPNVLKAHNIKVIGQGFHSANHPDRVRPATYTGQFIIPAGSEIYRDETGLLVSNKIMFTGKIIY